jgi:hypothetical protein
LWHITLALVYIVKVYARQALNRELLIEFHHAAIQPDRAPDFSGFVFPGTDTEAPDAAETPDLAGTAAVIRQPPESC